MFTGLIEEVGELISFHQGTLRIACQKVKEGTKLGDSIAINGVCLTVTQIHPQALDFHVSPTTLKHTLFQKPYLVKYVNLERAMKASDRFGGHIVTGHVDGLSRLLSLHPDGADKVLEFEVLSSWKQAFVSKGSVAISGISLTIAERLSSSFKVNIIPHTYENTILRHLKYGDMVHLEIDILARYAIFGQKV